MSLLARFFEGKGIPTASIYFQDEMVERFPAPRMLQLRWPFGHPYGEPGRPLLQATVLHRVLRLFETCGAFGELETPDWPWRRTDPSLPDDWQNTLT